MDTSTTLRILLPLSFLLSLCILASVTNTVSAEGYNYNYDRAFCVNESDPTDDLAFVNPTPIGIELYPVRLVTSMEDRYSIVHCCGTGFTSVRWYHNRQLISHNKSFSFKEGGQVLHWEKASPVGFSHMSCELVKNETVTLSHSMRVMVVPSAHHNGIHCEELRPFFTILPRNPCASVGDTVSVDCEIHFGDDKCTAPIFKLIQFFDENDTYISPVIDGYDNIHISRFPADDRHVSVLSTLTFSNITEKQLNTKYYCLPRRHDYTKADFEFVGPCKAITTKKTVEVPKYFDSKLAAKISISILVVLSVVIVAAALIYMYRREIAMLCNKYVTPTNKGFNEYDAYIVCSKDEQDQQFFMDHVLKHLEEHYQLCVPDRDFLLGSVIPDQITEYINSSKRVVVITSPGILQTDYCDLSLSVAVTSNIPLIFIKPPSLQLTDQHENFEELLSNSPEVSSAIAISKVIIFPQEESSGDAVASFYNSLYDAMPLTNKGKGSDASKVDAEKIA